MIWQPILWALIPGAPGVAIDERFDENGGVIAVESASLIVGSCAETFLHCRAQLRSAENPVMRKLRLLLLLALIAGCNRTAPAEACPEERDMERVVACWQKVVVQYPDDPTVRNNYGAALMNTGKPEAALAQYYEAYRLKPALDVAQFNIAATELRLGRAETAQKYAEEFIAQHPDMATGWLLAASVLSKRAADAAKEENGEDRATELRKKAEVSWSTVCNLKIEGAETLQRADIANGCAQLAFAQVARGDASAAEASCEIGFRARPESAQLLRARIKAYAAQKKYDAALADARTLAELPGQRESSKSAIDWIESERKK